MDILENTHLIPTKEHVTHIFPNEQNDKPYILVTIVINSNIVRIYDKLSLNP